MNDIYTSRAGGELITRRYRDALADWQTPNEHRLVATSQGDPRPPPCTRSSMRPDDAIVSQTADLLAATVSR